MPHTPPRRPAQSAPSGASQNRRRASRCRRRKFPLPRLLALALIVLLLAALGVSACRKHDDGEPSSEGEVGRNVPSSSQSSETPSSSEEEPAEPSSSSGSLPPQESGVASESAPESASEPASASASSVAVPEDWRLVLVNPTHKLDGDYDVELAPVQGSYQMDARMAEDMKAMLEAAKEDGYRLQICSAYRSTARSAVLYENKVQEYKGYGYDDDQAAVEAAKWVAPPGTSEHNTGLAADIVSSDYFSKYADLEHEFETFPEFAWLYEHCAEYGFILRYPKDKQEITGITYEPWHYRYVGREAAKEIMDQKICLEEYLGEE